MAWVDDLIKDTASTINLIVIISFIRQSIRR